MPLGALLPATGAAREDLIEIEEFALLPNRMANLPDLIALLEVETGNTAARALYRGEGFTPSGEYRYLTRP